MKILSFRAFVSFAVFTMAVAINPASAYQWQLDEVEVKAVIQQVAALTGKSFVVDPAVQGRVQLYAQSADSIDEIYQLFLSALDSLGYTTQHRGEQIHILPKTIAAQQVSHHPLAQISLHIFALQHAKANDILMAIKPLCPSWITLSEYSVANHLLFAGDKRTLENIRHLIARLDVPSVRRQYPMQVYRLQSISLAEAVPAMVNVLQQALGEVLVTTIKAPQAGVTVATADAPVVISEHAASVIAQPDLQQIVVFAPAAQQLQVQSVLAVIDQQPPQVRVEAMIAQVDTDALAALGLALRDGSLTIGGGGTSLQGLTSAWSSPMLTWQVALQALVQNQRAEILAQPVVLTLNRRRAQVEVGQRVSVQQTSYANQATSGPHTTFARENVSLSLQVTPRVLDERQIELDLIHQNNTLTSPHNPGANPQVNVSRLQTQVRVNDGETVVLGGIIQKEQLQQVVKVPVLGDIPLLGRLFRRHQTQSKKKVLLILLKPTIVR